MPSSVWIRKRWSASRISVSISECENGVLVSSVTLVLPGARKLRPGDQISSMNSSSPGDSSATCARRAVYTNFMSAMVLKYFSSLMMRWVDSLPSRLASRMPISAAVSSSSRMSE